MTSGDKDDQALYDQMEREVAQYDDVPGISNEPSYHQEAPRQQEQYSEQRHREPEPQYQQQQQAPKYQLPDVNEDPISHFQHRAGAAEQHIRQLYGEREDEKFWNRIHASEAEAHGEIGDDYYQAAEHLKNSRMQELAQQFPDRDHAAQVVAHRYGFPTAAALRVAILQNDAVTVARHAMQSGISPASAYYNLSLQRGFKPSVRVGRSQERAIVNALEHAPDREKDILWNWYRTQKLAEER